MDSIDLSVQENAVLVAGMFLRNTLFRWSWEDALVDGEFTVRELTTAFVKALAPHELTFPTRMTLRLRAVSAARLMIELHDAPENADILTGSRHLITEGVKQVSVRSGQYRTGRRTILWAELARPELSSRWIEAERMHCETRANWAAEFIDMLRPQWQLDAIAARKEKGE